MPVATATAMVVLLMVAVARLLPLDRVAAPTAIVTWLCVLTIGAICTISAIALTVIYLPETALYSFVASLCVHVTFPIISPHVGLSGHTALHAAMALPIVGLLASVLWLISRLTNGWWTLRARLRGSVETNEGLALIEDKEIVLGVAPLGRGRIVVSDTALRAMDPAELEAGLSHEAAHIRRGHRSITLVARLLAALGFLFPGTRQARRNLHQALERDADEYAVRKTNDPLSLASAICKVATGPNPAGEIGLAGGMVSRRLDYLEGHLPMAGPHVRRSMHLVATIFVAATIVFAASTSAWALGAPVGDHAWSITGTVC